MGVGPPEMIPAAERMSCYELHINDKIVTTQTLAQL